MSTSSIIEKIRNLIARAESSNHKGEVENCMALVEKLLAKHNLNPSDITPEDQRVVIDRDFATAHDSESWHRMLLGVLARFYGCKTVNTKIGYKYHLTVAGRFSNVETLRLMWPFVLSQVAKAAKELRNDHPGLSYDKSRRQVANALIIRVSNMLEDVAQNDERSAYALMPVDEIDALFADAFGVLSKGRKVSIGSSREARDKANGISLHRQAGGGSTLRLK